METLPEDIERKLEKLPVVSFDASDELPRVLATQDFIDIFNYYKEHFLPDVLKSQPEIYQKVSLYLTLTGQDTAFANQTDQVLFRRPVPTMEEFLNDDFYHGKLTATMYPYWKEQLCNIFRENSPVRKVIFGGSIGCLSKDTVIATLHGNKTIKTLLQDFSNEWVLSYNVSNNSWEPDKIIDVFYTGIKKVYRITLDNGKTIDCTSNHRFLTRNNKWVSIDNGLQLGLSMIPYYYEISKENTERKDKCDRKIVSIEYIGEKEVFDITTEKNHNFALEAGIVAHNSGKSTIARKAIVYSLYRALCLRYPRAAFNVDEDTTLANFIVSVTIKQVFDTNLMPFVSLLNNMPCFQSVRHITSFDGFNLDDPYCPIPFWVEKSSGTIFFPNNFILSAGSQVQHTIGYSIINSFCFTEDTKVYTNKGILTFKELENRFKNNESFTTKSITNTKEIIDSNITNVQITGYKQDFIKIYITDTDYIECTPEHPFVIANPKENDPFLIYENGIPYKYAKDLTEEDELEEGQF